MESYTLINREQRKLFPQARFLSEEEQGLYEQEIKRFSGKAYDSLNIPQEGSNLWKVLFLNQIGIRTATLPELELALENGMDLSGTYEDASSVVLRSNGDFYERNDYLAKILAKNIKKMTFKNPLILNGLELKADENSAYGLILVPGKKFQEVEAPDFSHKNNKRKFSRINKDYSIEWNDDSNRYLYTRDSGLSRLYLDGVLNAVASCGDLADSDDDGRVVVVNSVKGAKKL